MEENGVNMPVKEVPRNEFKAGPRIGSTPGSYISEERSSRRPVALAAPGSYISEERSSPRPVGLAAPGSYISEAPGSYISDAPVVQSAPRTVQVVTPSSDGLIQPVTPSLNIPHILHYISSNIWSILHYIALNIWPILGEVPSESEQLDDEERSSMGTYERKAKPPLHERVYLLKAALIGDWRAAESTLVKYSEAIRTPVIQEGDTALHIAVAGNQTIFATELMKLMTPEDLMLKEKHGQTAFFYAAGSGNVSFAKEMVKRNRELPLVSDGEKRLPIHIAIQSGHKDMVQYLVSVTPFEYLTPYQRVGLLRYSIFVDMYDLALEILRNDQIFGTTNGARGMDALELLASKTVAIGGTRERSRWKIGFKGANHKADMQASAYQLVEDLWKQIQKLPEGQFLDLVDKHLIIFHTAAKLGNIEFLTIILCSYPELIWRENENKQNLFHIAILNRQESIFSLIYEIGDQKNFIVANVDKNKNSMLHLVAQLAPPERLILTVGAALQMQREFLWFKAIEKIVPPVLRDMGNSEGVKPRDIFIEAHKDLRKEGEKWMKSTANSCMIVATLIATIVFAATFTIPGGNNQESGIPILLENTWFLVFFVSNAIALLSSSTSILMFLSILTSRYKDEDFLKSLPGRLVFGLTMLFISIVGMVLAFSATCFLVYQSKIRRIPIIIMALASLPVILFLRLHYDLWFDIISTTYWSKFYFRARKHGLFRKLEDDIRGKK